MGQISGNNSDWGWRKYFNAIYFVILLDEQMRLQEDKQFSELLNRARGGCTIDKDYWCLIERVGQFDQTEDTKVIARSNQFR